jgi:hypothetical protein
MSSLNKKPTSRTMKRPKYSSFKLEKPIKHHVRDLLSGNKILKKSFKLLKKNKGLYLRMSLLYGFLLFILVRLQNQGLDVVGTKQTLQAYLKGNFDNLGASATLFGLLIGSALATTSTTAILFQIMLLIFFSLAIIWSLRQSNANRKNSLKESFYSGMYPLVQFCAVLVVMLLQLIPFRFGKYIYDIVQAQYLAVSSIEKSLWVTFYAGSGLISLYLLCSSVFALYIVSLPDMTPMRALRAAKNLIEFRRIQVGLRILAMPVYLLSLGGLIMIPTIYFAPGFAEVVFYFIAMLALPAFHSYLYVLYLELLKNTPTAQGQNEYS